MTPRIPPKNAQTFSPGNVIRLEFPAQGYVNPGKTTLEFDVTLSYTPTNADFSAVRFQNNIQSCFSRVRLLYGSTPLEDIPNYNYIVRALTEWTGSDPLGADQTSVSDGIGGIMPTISGSSLNGSANVAIAKAAGSLNPVIGNVRQKIIQGVDLRVGALLNDADANTNTGFGVVPNGTSITALATRVSINSKDPVRRYQVQLALGLLTQEKLIPTKFMASQLAIEITLANPADCIYQMVAGTQSTPTYSISNVNLIPEILEFDASYDESFLRGLQNGGVPIKFATWNNYRFSATGQQTMNLQIQERSRSVKAIFAMLRREQPLLQADSGATFFNADVTTTDAASTLQDFQFRIGGRYLIFNLDISQHLQSKTPLLLVGLSTTVVVKVMSSWQKLSTLLAKLKSLPQSMLFDGAPCLAKTTLFQVYIQCCKNLIMMLHWLGTKSVEVQYLLYLVVVLCTVLLAPLVN